MAASPTVESFLEHVVQAFEASLETTALLRLSTGLRQQYREAFRKKGFGMTPSYLYNMPAGTERGTYVSMDIGGTVLKLALVRLNERQPDQGSGASTLLRLKTWTMDNAVKDSGSVGVYDWVASRLKETLFGPEDPWAEAHAVPSIGLACRSWIARSTSIKTATILVMGKGLEKCSDLVGAEVGALVTEACRRNGFEVTVDAIVHDLSGNVLADAYRSDAPCLSLIYGTGVNAALDFPAGCVAPEKFPRGTQTAEGLPASVIMNTELSTYGKHVLPTTTWDDQLNGAHARPDMQPLEYLVGGRYLGEIVRLIVVDAVHETGLFGGHLPSSLSRPYSLDTALMADIERDPSTTLARILEAENQEAAAQAPEVTKTDSLCVQRICQAVSNRAAAYLATALHALWALRDECRAATAAYHGSVIAKYPGLKERCQVHLDQLTCRTDGRGRAEVKNWGGVKDGVEDGGRDGVNNHGGVKNREPGMKKDLSHFFLRSTPLL
ncbi:MAG: hypothetical protein M1815_003368 [Lichina confinis]|nr:MAG: hypothetical protein M1815_003368 [Lichina confinis]